MADEIHAAKHVHKMNSTSLGAFASPDTGPIGRMVEGGPYLLARPITAPTTGAGPVLRSTYGFPGSERDLQDRRLINSGFLGPFTARVLLHVLIAADTDHHEIVTAFDAASGQVAMPG